MKRRFLILSIVYVTLSVVEGGQGRVFSQSIQDSVYNLYLDFARSKTTEAKIENNRKFSEGLRAVLSADTKGELTFDSLKKYKVMIQSPDKEVRIFTWNIEAEDATHTFYGFVHAYVRKLKKFETYQLNDKSEGMKDPENAILDNTKWFGAYYYDVIFVKHKKKKYYVLLGWDGNNTLSNKRLIDVLYFTDRGFPKFGDAIFTSETGKIKKRIIFEYQAGLFMSLKYDDEKKAIMFDHLSPSNPNLEGQFSFYGPDFSYDMMQFKDGKWLYIKDVLPRNDQGKPDKHFNAPK